MRIQLIRLSPSPLVPNRKEFWSWPHEGTMADLKPDPRAAHNLLERARGRCRQCPGQGCHPQLPAWDLPGLSSCLPAQSRPVRLQPGEAQTGVLLGPQGGPAPACSLAQAHMPKSGLWTSAAKPLPRSAAEWSLIKVISVWTGLSQSRFPNPDPGPCHSSYPVAVDLVNQPPAQCFSATPPMS